MILSQEYKQRHTISVPLIFHQQKSYLLLDHDFKKYPSKWMLFSVNRVESNNSIYQVRLSYPKHNSYADKSIFKNEYSISLNYSEFEQWMYKNFSSLNHRPLLNSLEIFCSLWEIFIFAYDGWFSDHNDFLIFDTIDPKNDFNSRCKSIKEILKELEFSQKYIYDSWMDNMESLINNYSYWMGDILNVNQFEFAATGKSFIRKIT